MRTRVPVSEARRAESVRAQARRAEARRAELLVAESQRADQLRATRRRALELAASPGAVLGVAAFAVTWAASSLVPALVVGLVLGILAGAAAWSLAVPVTMRLVGATLAPSERQPRAHNLLDGLCPGAGVPKPELWVLDTPVPNSMVVGTDPARARLVLTTGLLDVLTLVELEAVLAHELMHLRSGDAVPATVAISSGWALAGRLPGRHREEAADLAALSLTRYPPGLAAALEKVPDRIPLAGLAARLTGHIWLASPGAPAGPRAAVLRQM